MERETRSVPLDKSERVRAEVKMAAGELNIEGGAKNLVDAEFEYNVPAWKPEVQYRSSGSVGDLSITQPGSKTSTGGDQKNRWNLELNDEVPLDLRVECGAGEAKLKLGSTHLSSISVTMGAGTLALDLRGKPAKDYSVHVVGGVGEATIRVPGDVGVTAKVAGGLGDISVRGLHKQGDSYVNDAYERASTRIRIDVQGGIGSVKLIAE